MRVRSPWDLATVDGSPSDDSAAGVAVGPELGEGFGGFRRTERGGDHRLGDGRPFGEGRVDLAVEGEVGGSTWARRSPGRV